MKNMLTVVASCVLLAACGSKSTEGSLSAALSEPEFYSYAEQPINNSWPSAEDNVDLSANLTASNYFIVFDGSGSMQSTACEGGGAKIDVAKQAVNDFIRRIPGDANIGLYLFDDKGARLVSVLGSPRQQILAAIAAARTNGGTPLGQAVAAASDALTLQARRQLGYGEYHMVIITDGEADSIDDLNNSVYAVLAQTPIIVHTVGFCIGEGHTLNMKGKTVYHAANSAQEIRASLEQVLTEAPDYSSSQFEKQAP